MGSILEPMKNNKLITGRDYRQEAEARVGFICGVLEKAGASGIVFANSGGKDCALVGILCKLACENTLSLILPCGIVRSYHEDMDDALRLAEHFKIESRTLDLKPAYDALVACMSDKAHITEEARANIAPRLRMQALYAVALSEGRLVAGTGNRSEIFLGYFTKWGDGAYDFNPIADLTVTEVYEFLRFFGAPECIIEKSPSAGLFEGQTDESDLGFRYCELDSYLMGRTMDDLSFEKFMKRHKSTMHKRDLPATYTGQD